MDHIYQHLVCGTLMLSVKQAFSRAPNIEYVRAIVVREKAPDAYGNRRFEALLGYATSKTRLTGILWGTASSPDIINDTAIRVAGKTKANYEFVPLDPQKNKDIGEVLGLIDYQDD